MRLWMIDPTLLCRKHLIAEHCECHMFVGTISKGKSISGYVTKGLVDTTKIKFRHDQLAKEMIVRGYKHMTLLVYKDELKLGIVALQKSLCDLYGRCNDCRR